jgi:hypothetical protein
MERREREGGKEGRRNDTVNRLGKAFGKDIFEKGLLSRRLSKLLFKEVIKFSKKTGQKSSWVPLQKYTDGK